MTTQNLSGKVALIQGGSRGIGAAIVKRLAAEGATVAFTYVSSTAKAEELKNSLKGEKAVTPVVAPQPVLVNKKITPQFKALTRDLAKVEQRMAELGRRKSDLEKKLSEPLAPQEIGALGLELQAVTDALAAAEESWLALSEQIELEK